MFVSCADMSVLLRVLLSLGLSFMLTNSSPVRFYFSRCIILSCSLTFFSFLDMVRVESLHELSDDVIVRFLERNYHTLLCIAPLAPAALNFTQTIPRFVGPVHPLVRFFPIFILAHLLLPHVALEECGEENTFTI